MDLSPILVRGVSPRGQGRGIHSPAARGRRQQAPERGKRTDADLRLGREAQRHAGLLLEHPGRHLEASAGIPNKAAPDHGGTASLGHVMDVDGETAPGMPRIQQHPYRGPVGVQAPSCTTPDARTAPSPGRPPMRPLGWSRGRDWRPDGNQDRAYSGRRTVRRMGTTSVTTTALASSTTAPSSAPAHFRSPSCAASACRTG
jgi:hypothetical protein